MSIHLSEEDLLFSIFSDLCMEHERASFSHRLLAGLYLTTELNALP